MLRPDDRMMSRFLYRPLFQVTANLHSQLTKVKGEVGSARGVVTPHLGRFFGDAEADGCRFDRAAA